jgi:MoaA/NifB/PqqE/SkfB family radical SAM enzyme
MGPTGGLCRVVQFHVSQRCNLACRHCYSSSGPGGADGVEPADFADALTDAAALGYNVAGFSGGEPLLYRALPELLGHAKTLGLVTTVTTNGILLGRRRLATLRDRADLIAISLDGTPQSHDRMRGLPGAFEAMARRLPELRDTGIPFGFIFTLTLHNLNELPWVADFALEQGASLLQIHPLESVGRARTEFAGSVPDSRELSWAVLAAARIEDLVGERLQVQLDVAAREVIAREPERVFAAEAQCPADTNFAALLSPLVIEPDGTAVPIEYGLRRDLALGNIAETPLSTLAARWREDVWPRFQHLCRTVHADVTREDAPEVLNWYGRVSEAAAAA